MFKRLIILLAFSVTFILCNSLTTLHVSGGNSVNIQHLEFESVRAMKLPIETLTAEEGNENDASNSADNSEEDSRSSDESKALNLPAQPEIISNKVIGFEALDKSDTTEYAWWFLPNKEHKPTYIPPYAKKLIEKYEGIYIGDTTKKVVYLTFDEGYENGYTPKILDVLKANDVKSIFFITGGFLENNRNLVKSMLDEGHQVGNHTINHPSLPSLSSSKLEDELYGLEKQFNEAFGKGMKYMRPPRGEYSEKVLSAAKELGYKTIFWSYTRRDFELNKQQGEDVAYKAVMENLHNGAVILLHAVSKDNADALDKIIKGIKEQGYTISPFDL